MRENKLKVAVVQQDIIWEKVEANLLHLDRLLGELNKPVDLVILPEMFACGFTMQPDKIVRNGSEGVLAWMENKASELGAYVMGSTVYKEGDAFYNRLYVVAPDGESQYYNKRHLFSIGGEGEVYRSGRERLIINIRGLKICPLICYDLRFPVWSRNDMDYDMLVYVANWPKSRKEVWSTLLKARAIENQCYVVGVNRVGVDNANTYNGDSTVIDAKGRVILDLVEGKESIGIINISKSELLDFKTKFPAWKDADVFKLI